MKTLAQTLRVKHYFKNIFVLLPLFFSFEFMHPVSLVRAGAAFLAFCCAASAVYIFNDLHDRERDARHPVKKDRPIASGRVSVRAAVLLLAVMGLAATALSLALDWRCLLVTMGYAVLNISYTLRLKAIPIVDVACIALGFILRVMMGGAAIDVPLSHWLLLTITAISFYLGFGKRANEKKRMGEDCQTREVLSRYSDAFLRQVMTVMMALTVILYALWTIDPSVTARFGTNLVYTTILVILLILRYAYILDGQDSHGDPVTVLLGDKPLLFGGAAYVAVLLLLAFTDL